MIKELKKGKACIYWSKLHKKWAIHTQKKVHYENVVYVTLWETGRKASDTTSFPRGWVVTTPDQILIGEHIDVEDFKYKSEKFLYSTTNRKFNIESGECLLLTPDGTWVVGVEHVSSVIKPLTPFI